VKQHNNNNCHKYRNPVPSLWPNAQMLTEHYSFLLKTRNFQHQFNSPT